MQNTELSTKKQTPKPTIAFKMKDQSFQSQLKTYSLSKKQTNLVSVTATEPQQKKNLLEPDGVDSIFLHTPKEESACRHVCV